jgi:hypothetical protein
MERASLASARAAFGPPQQPDGFDSAQANRAHLERTLAGELGTNGSFAMRSATTSRAKCVGRDCSQRNGGSCGSITDITERACQIADGRRTARVRASGCERHLRITSRRSPMWLSASSMNAFARFDCWTSKVCVCNLRRSTRAADYVRWKALLWLHARLVRAAVICSGVIVADLARDALWENVRPAALASDLRACW